MSAKDKIEEAAREWAERSGNCPMGMPNIPALASWARTLIAEAVAEKDREIERLRVETKLNNDPTSYSSMVYWRENCYWARSQLVEARARIASLEAGAHKEEVKP